MSDGCCGTVTLRNASSSASAGSVGFSFRNAARNRSGSDHLAKARPLRCQFARRNLRPVQHRILKLAEPRQSSVFDNGFGEHGAHDFFFRFESLPASNRFTCSMAS